MPFFLLGAGALLAGASFGIGRFSRQGEVDELKQIIMKLEKELKIHQEMIARQNNVIKELKVENQSLNAIFFMKRAALSKRTRGIIIFQYALKEYLQLVRLHVDGMIKTNSPQELMYNILNRLFHGKDVSLEEKGLVKVYIQEKYPYEIKRMIAIEENDLYVALGG
ncbi:hypothetical protein [Exiguobacterium alkaliphilum]|uniref:Uncharacterized protein n=1 Tax=Exiguobacterium alkaliphilum TaxID=1428684 RepID=A0ABT2L2V6_9BACL|nr:hypothetical protein [Exiguobacterium alkaliphilum]MCT4796350.1 hypothetical protein [Exiguobacterium alkaliphilum]